MEKIIDTTGIELVRVPMGEFTMGSSNELFSEAPPRRVRITKPFWIGKYPVTQEQWVRVMGKNPSKFNSNMRNPVDNVSWIAASEFCSRVSDAADIEVRLPTEAEWEYACRAGSTADFHFLPSGSFGDETEIPTALRMELCEFAWFDLNSLGSTQPIGGKRPNNWEIFDIIGNVWEWCSDVWNDNYQHRSDEPAPWLEKGDSDPRRCLRGGAWDMNAFRCRSTYRSYDHKELATSRFGLRIVTGSDVD